MKTQRKGRGYRKGQAVMEYLITYGLALFVILVVLAILVAVVLPSLKAPEMCQFSQQGFSCNQKQHVLVANTGSNDVSLFFRLDNGVGSAVKILGVLCTDETVGDVTKDDVKNNGLWNDDSLVSMGSGQSHEFGVGDTNEVDCVKSDGTAVVLTPSSNFKGTLAIVYKLENEVEGAPPRLAVATLSGTVQEAE